MRENALLDQHCHHGRVITKVAEKLDAADRECMALRSALDAIHTLLATLANQHRRAASRRDVSHRGS